MRKELVELYAQYLKDSVAERTHELTDLEKGGTKTVEFKGDFDGFIRWLQTQNDD